MPMHDAAISRISREPQTMLADCRVRFADAGQAPPAPTMPYHCDSAAKFDCFALPVDLRD